MTTTENTNADLMANFKRLQCVLEELHTSHERLEARAARMAEELEQSNTKLAAKVGELDQTNQFLEAILSSLPTGVIVRDAAGNIVRANLASRNILEWQAEELTDAKQTLPLSQNGDSGRWIEFQTARGEVKTVALSRSDVQDSHGAALGSVQIVADQTALAQATRQVHQQSKMAALGTMAGGIAHEIRNPMNAVRGFAGLLARPDIDLEKVQRYARNIEAGVVEVDSIVTALSRLANPDQITREAIDAQSLAQEALDQVNAHEVCTKIQWQTDFAPTDFHGDAVQLRQSLRNLLANSVHAQNGEGPIRFTCNQENETVVFSVSDSGPGLDAGTAQRCTDPFFTTRADGMGLGLALVDRIARLHGGRLEVSNTPSHLGGACVRLYIPTS